eukprot:TRINITY_DN6947_c2_g1_i1.p1 TRINITY_DN6947_c2_g1~~TRINITY_DN6947_c2_g1_i1.p1  ORF type:complete len:985 (+),score=259.29 TRINITY_DN6947_c2_g1_i1:316-2955(+)
MLFLANGADNVAVVVLVAVCAAARRVGRRGVAECLALVTVVLVAAAAYYSEHTTLAGKRLPASMHWLAVLGALSVVYLATTAPERGARRGTFGRLAFADASPQSGHDTLREVVTQTPPALDASGATPAERTPALELSVVETTLTLHTPTPEGASEVKTSQMREHLKRHSAPIPIPPSLEDLANRALGSPHETHTTTTGSEIPRPSPMARESRALPASQEPTPTALAEKGRSVSFVVEVSSEHEPSPKSNKSASPTHYMSGHSGLFMPSAGRTGSSGDVTAQSFGEDGDLSVSQSADESDGGVLSLASSGCSQKRSRVRANVTSKASVRTVEKTLRWQKGELLGQGGFGKVYVGLNHDTGELMAVKTIEFVMTDKNLKKKLEQLALEIKIMSTLVHPHIVRYYFTERTGASVNIFMEYISGGSIGEILKSFGKLDEDLVVQYSHQLLLGVAHLHQQGVVHRDIKCCNVLLSVEGLVKLADFGASVIVDHGKRADDQQGTPFWMAPEVLRDEEHGWEADIWSFGCTVMEMFTAVQPWAHLNLSGVAVCHWICEDSNAVTTPEGLSVAASELLLDCLPRKAKLRYAAEDLLEHPFFFENADELALQRREDRARETSEAELRASACPSESDHDEDPFNFDGQSWGGGFEPSVRPTFVADMETQKRTPRRSRVSIMPCVPPSPLRAGGSPITASLYTATPPTQHAPALPEDPATSPPLQSLTPGMNPMVHQIGKFLARRVSQRRMDPSNLISRDLSGGSATLFGRSEGTADTDSRHCSERLGHDADQNVEVQESIIVEPEAESTEKLEQYYLSVADRKQSLFSIYRRASAANHRATTLLPPMPRSQSAASREFSSRGPPHPAESPVISVTAPGLEQSPVLPPVP